MTSKMFPALVVLLISSAAVAQAGPVAEKSSDQIICEMTGDCAAADASLATQDKPSSRGFAILGPAKAAPAQSGAAPRAGAARRAPGASHYVAPSQAPRYAPSARGLGRSDLAINFVSGSATLTDSGRRQAQQFLKALSAPQLAGKRYQVVGHTDAVGARDYNVDLSQRRAQAVVDFLVQNGASRTQFDPKGIGFDRLANPRNPRAAENRRVEFVKID